MWVICDNSFFFCVGKHSNKNLWKLPGYRRLGSVMRVLSPADEQLTELGSNRVFIQEHSQKVTQTRIVPPMGANQK